VIDEIKAGSILIKESTQLPETVQIESSPCVRGWQVVKDFDVHGMDRKIRKAGWSFFSLAGEIQALAFGADKPLMIRRAIMRILHSPQSQKFNALEITHVRSKRFLGVRYLRVSAQSRNIQRSLFLVPAAGTRKQSQTTSAAAGTTGWNTISPKGLPFRAAGPRAKLHQA
jgi:hypothetical protein